MPKRIQRKRAKGWRKPESAIIVDRTSRWGNPWPVTDDRSAEEAVNMFRDWIAGDRFVNGRPAPTHSSIKMMLGGADLACWCPLDQPCHADVLLKIANS